MGAQGLAAGDTPSQVSPNSRLEKNLQSDRRDNLISLFPLSSPIVQVIKPLLVRVCLRERFFFSSYMSLKNTKNVPLQLFI